MQTNSTDPWEIPYIFKNKNSMRVLNLKRMVLYMSNSDPQRGWRISTARNISKIILKIFDGESRNGGSP